MAAPTVKLDETNRALVELLRGDGRLTNQELAERLGLPASTVRDRVRRLSESKVLRVIALTDFRALGFDFLIFLGVRVEGRPALDAATDLAASRRVTSVCIVAGKYDLWVMVAVRDKKELSDFVTVELGCIAGIRDIDIALALDVMKFNSDFALPPRDEVEAELEHPLDGDLDDLDWQVVEQLRQDGRTPNREVARRLSVSEGTVRLRIKRLEEKRIIKVAGICSGRHFGMDTWVNVGITADRSSLRAVAQELRQNDAVSFVTTTLGAYDLVATIGGPRDQVFDLISRLGEIKGVRRTETADMLQVVKFNYTIAALSSDV